MCGIAGYLDPSQARPANVLKRIAGEMAAQLAHRGPDDDGVFADPDAGLALGFRRLAIQDLSADGAQPMRSASGRYVIVFNGEVYNFRERRADLEANGVGGWRGGSDTEVMLAAIERDGLLAALGTFEGMFAFALYDRAERRLYLVRDRMGEKPLYYGWAGGAFVFGSELKALTVAPGWTPRIDRAALSAFMRYGYIPAPHSIYDGIRKLRPGHCLTLDLGQLVAGALPEPVAYWDARRHAEAAGEAPVPDNDGQAASRLEDLLTRSIGRRLIADVPLGVFLSGGIDSTVVAALACRVSAHPVRTFTIGFEDPRFDEAAQAAAVAHHLGTDHLELTASPDAMLNLVTRMPAVYDEPFADASQLPTLLLAELTRRHVTVALSGDGGDELFAGYPRYQAAAARFKGGARAWGRLARRLDGVAECLNRVTIGPRPWRLGDKLHCFAEDSAAATIEGVYEAYNARWRTARAPCPQPAIGYFADRGLWADIAQPMARMMYADAMSYLPDDLQVKIDRATMAASLEARAPMLDHGLVEFAWRLPVGMKVRDGQTKWLLRQVLDRHVPKSLIDRPKQGFEPPLGAWLRGPLRDWAEDLFAAASRHGDGLLDMAPVRAIWQEHLSGVRDWRFELWHVLMFQAWRSAWRA